MLSRGVLWKMCFGALLLAEVSTLSLISLAILQSSVHAPRFRHKRSNKVVSGLSLFHYYHALREGHDPLGFLLLVHRNLVIDAAVDGLSGVCLVQAVRPPLACCWAIGTVLGFTGMVLWVALAFYRSVSEMRRPLFTAWNPRRTLHIHA